jgi:hypothetical protein
VTSHMLTVLAINIGLIALSYGVIYPRFVGSSIPRLLKFDVGVTGLALLTAGVLYFGRGLEFNVFGLTFNWFFFSLATYFVLELPVMSWYMQRNGMVPQQPDTLTAPGRRNDNA